MSDAKKNKEDLVNKSKNAIDKLDSNEQGRRRVPNTSDPNSPAAIARRKAAAKAKPKPKKSPGVGVGTDNTDANAAALANQMRAKIKAARASGNTAFADKLAARLAAIQKSK